MRDYYYDTSFASGADAAGFAGAFALLYCCVAIVLFVVMGFIYYKLAKKMGYNPWMGLLMFVPFLNIVLPFIVVFTKWPIEEELERLRGGKPKAKEAKVVEAEEKKSEKADDEDEE